MDYPNAHHRGICLWIYPWVDPGSLMPMTQHLMDMGDHKYPSLQNNLPHESPPCDHGFENNLILLLGLNASVSYRKLRKKIKEI